VIWVKRAGLILALLGVILLIVWTIRLAQIGLSLQGHLSQAQSLANAESLDLAEACSLVRDLRGDVVALRREVWWLVRLAPAFGWLPGVGGDLQAAPHLLDTANGLTEAGALTCNALEPALAASGGTGGTSESLSPEGITRLLAEKQPSLEQALAAAERAQEAWGRVDQERLSEWLAGKASPLDKGLPLLVTGLKAATVAPEILGADGPCTYLILALNEDELRAGGGFVSGVGEVRVEAGQIITMTFQDSYAVDDFSQPYPASPEPMQRYMGIDIWVFRDSNWSPDFPTAARQAIALYRPGYPVSIDGVIAVDQEAVRRLVSAIGPLEVEGTEEPVTGETVISYMHQSWAPEEGEKLDLEWWKQRKAFMGALAQAIWVRVRSGDIDWVTLAQISLRLLEEKHVLIYLEHPEAASLLAEQGWDGALRPTAGDYLMVVDTNVGYNKANARVHQEIVYEVDLRPSPPQATLTLIYTHTSTADYPCIPETRYDPTYEQMIDRCYWDYVRIYVPLGSQLLEATRIPVSGEALFSGEAEPGQVSAQTAEEGPWTTFAVLGLLPPSETQTRSFTWTLPADVVQWDANEGTYLVRVQKQPGTRGYPLTIRVRLPDKGVFLNAAPEPSAMEESWTAYETRLDRDREFELRFRREP
jgi:hypothetical protein